MNAQSVFFSILAHLFIFFLLTLNSLEVSIAALTIKSLTLQAYEDCNYESKRLSG